MTNPVVVQYGGIPFPVGGVTVHIYRLSARLEADGFETVIHDRIGGEKLETSSKLLTGPLGLWRLMWRRSAIHHLHVSIPGPAALLFLLGFTSLLPTKRTCVTFHSGRFPGEYQSGIHRFLLRLLATRVGTWFALNSASRDFLGSLPCRASIVPCASYIRSTEWHISEQSLSEEMRRLRADVDCLIVSSGYRIRNSRFDEIALAAKRLGARCGVVIVGYGDTDEGYMGLVAKAMTEVPSLILEGLSPEEFGAVLKAADVYVRHTRTDSYGMAIAEALELGTAAIATDACERASGCLVYGVDDEQHFDELLRRALESTDLVLAPADGYPSLIGAYRAMLMANV